jgi:hypothetical protein
MHRLDRLARDQGHQDQFDSRIGDLAHWYRLRTTLPVRRKGQGEAWCVLVRRMQKMGSIHSMIEKEKLLLELIALHT